MFVYIRSKGDKQYRRAYGGEIPSRSPKNGWKKGQKYTAGAHMYIIDAVDVFNGGSNAGKLKLYATLIK